MFDIHKIISINKLQLLPIVDTTLQTDQQMSDRLTLLCNHLIFGIVAHLTRLDHTLQNNGRHFQIFIMFECPDQLVYYLQVEMLAIEIPFNV